MFGQTAGNKTFIQDEQLPILIFEILKKWHIVSLNGVAGWEFKIATE